ncbi:phospholipase D family protein [Uliginosibacterium sp. sgz301328]|uniref:phospholipase D family nuclease n=1 Tax=Uliginosibacterium sp. sgz301328 TaxID=3243764 RepID=UPI00359CC7ED
MKFAVCRALCALMLVAACVAPPTAWGASGDLPAGARFESGFSPHGDAQAIVLHAIASADRQIRVAAYLFTSKSIATALVEARQRGVDVRVVADAKENRKGFTAVRYLANEGVPVRLNGRYAIHHDKFMVIDGETVETGSFNFTAAAATKNAENVLVLYDVKPLAESYLREWQRLWDEAEDMPPAF